MAKSTSSQATLHSEPPNPEEHTAFSIIVLSVVAIFELIIFTYQFLRANSFLEDKLEEEAFGGLTQGNFAAFLMACCFLVFPIAFWISHMSQIDKKAGKNLSDNLMTGDNSIYVGLLGCNIAVFIGEILITAYMGDTKLVPDALSTASEIATGVMIALLHQFLAAFAAAPHALKLMKRRG